MCSAVSHDVLSIDLGVPGHIYSDCLSLFSIGTKAPACLHVLADH